MSELILSLAYGSPFENDGNENTSPSYSGSADYIGIVSGTNYWPCWRWNNVTIPQGAMIDSAFLEVHLAGGNIGGAPTGTIYGVDEDDCAAWASGTKPSTRSKTSASVSYTCNVGTTTTEDTPDLKSIIQEIVNRAGWSSGNDLGLWWERTGAGADALKDIHPTASFPMKLTINYTEAAGGGSTPAPRRRFIRH